MSSDIAVEVHRLGKRYHRGAKHTHHDTLGGFLRHKARMLLGRDPAETKSEYFWALRDASFTIRRGENVGIIGLNGAGKSTLLKVLSRITEPTEGSARISGRVGALLEVGTGFHPELTGRENVFLYGSILGMTRQEVARKYDTIVDFSEVQDFIETPVKRYSSGMYVRLAFSVAAHLDPEILFLDEVLAVGDLAFQRKCMDYAKRLQQRDATILFVSHSMFSIKSMCERVIYVKKGRVEFDGSVEEGIALYEKDCRLAPVGGSSESSDSPVSITWCELNDHQGRVGTVFDMGDRIKVRFGYNAQRELENPNFIVTLTRSDGVVCVRYSTELDGIATGKISGEGKMEVTLPPLKLVAEMYTLQITVRRPNFQEVLCDQIATTLHVRHEVLNSHYGVFHEHATWRIIAQAGDGHKPTSS